MTIEQIAAARKISATKPYKTMNSSSQSGHYPQPNEKRKAI